MITRKTLFLAVLLLSICQSLLAISLSEQFKQFGYLEICTEKNEAATFDSLYAYFDDLIEFLRINPAWAHKLYSAKECFIRSKERNYYSTDIFGFYDESEREKKQISFYYSTHFHEFICSRYPECNHVPAIMRFFEVCALIQKSYGNLFYEAALELGIENRLSTLIKVIKYLPSYIASKPHYDGSALSLFLDSTQAQSLLLSPYKSALTIDDFSSSEMFSRQHNQNCILLIPGTLLTEFSIYPTPHIVIQSGKTRYATIAFAMRPNHIHQKIELTILPNFD